MWTHRMLLTLSLVGLSISGSDVFAQQRSDTVVKQATAPRNRGVATLVSELKIGGASATADEYMLTSVREIRPLRNGSLALVDYGGGTVFVRLYDPQGKYIRTLGRRGEGPGEYTSPNGVTELNDGRILVRDGRGGRVAIYADSTGTQWFSPMLSGTSLGQNQLLTAPNGSVFLQTIRTGPQGAPARSGYLRLRPDARVVDTLFSPTLAPLSTTMFRATRTSPGGGYSSSSFGLPFSPAMSSAFSPLGYFASANTGRYAIDLRVPPAQSAQWREGDPIISIRRTGVQSVAANDAERAEQRKRIEEQLRRLEPNWQWNGPEIPRVKPVIKNISFGLDGRVWVQLSTPSEKFDPAKEPAAPSMGIGGGGGAGRAVGGPPPPPSGTQLTWREPFLYDVFEPDGTYIGQVGVPFGTSIHARSGDHVWGVTRDADGVETVHRFRITWR